jgi:hypothetical protein
VRLEVAELAERREALEIAAALGSAFVDATAFGGTGEFRGNL